MLRNAILGFLALSAFAAAAAQASDVTLWAVDTEDGKLRVLSQSSGKVLSEVQIQVGATNVTKIHGLTRDPGSGDVYVAYQTAAWMTDHLGILDLGTAKVTDIGNTGATWRGLSFARSGDLFAIGDATAAPDTMGFGLDGVVSSDALWSINPGNGVRSGEEGMSGASTYSPIAFNPGDGMMYRAYSGGFQKFDPYAADASGSEVPITLSGATPGTISSLTWDAGGYFLATDLNFDIYRITSTSNVTASVTFVTQINGGVWPPLAPIIIINPEPASLALYGLGLLTLAGIARRRRRAAA